MRCENLVGQRFGHLSVVGVCDVSGGGRTKFICRCDCGKEVSVLPYNLRSGNSTSCGCFGRQNTIAASTKHGDRHTRLYKMWCGIKQRCYNKNLPCYCNYGGRGIAVCDEWVDDYESFKLWALSNGYKDSIDCTIDRIDVDKDYSPNNCRFANAKEQANNRRNTIRISAHGQCHTLSEWADITGVKYHTLYARIISFGLDPEECIPI